MLPCPTPLLSLPSWFLQSFEGGLGGEPWNEAHGGYTFCGVAALALGGRAGALDLHSLLRWAAGMQVGWGSGYSGLVCCGRCRWGVDDRGLVGCLCLADALDLHSLLRRAAGMETVRAFMTGSVLAVGKGH